jgi:hypothetical protein
MSASITVDTPGQFIYFPARKKQILITMLVEIVSKNQKEVAK